MVPGNASRAHYPDDTNIGRVLHTTNPSQVSSGVRSPGAQKADDIGFKILITHYNNPYIYSKKYNALVKRNMGQATRLAQAAPIWASSCSGLYPASCAEWEGQVAVQLPHPLHKISLISQTRCSRLYVMAS